MSLEQEIKLVVQQVEPIELSQLAWLTELAIAEPVEKHLVSTYFDTPELALKQFGVGLRMRKVDEQWLQTVKCSGHAVDGLHQRKEWEHPLQQAEFDIELLRQTDLAPLIDDDAVWLKIQPLFTTDFIRLEWPLRLDDETDIELAYDRGMVKAADKQSLIHEIELELKRGELKKMLKLADQLKAALPLEFCDVSKAAQGYGLI